MKLTSDNVDTVFKACLFKDGEDTTNHIEARGVQIAVGFNPKRIEDYKDNIVSMLSQLPTEFQSEATGGGGGWSFLQACTDKDGHQWTDLHQRMDQLFTLGLATANVVEQLPRDMWNILPGGMPYYEITL